jgi:outer membrane protein OmpA-like peptidoglycan-associated protein
MLPAMHARSSAQDTLRPRYGLFGGYALNVHSADFRALPGVPSCCPVFSSGSGGGMEIGALYEMPLSTWLLLGLRGSYVQHNATLSEREPVYLIVDGTGRDGAFEHSVDATISSIGLEPSLEARIFGGLFVGIGARVAGYTAHRYAQEERIVDPIDAGTFLDASGGDSHSRVRNQNAGEIPDAASLLAQGTIGLGYELPLNARGTLLLVPEVSYAQSFTDVVKDLDWKPNGLRAGLALKLSPAPKPRRFDTVIVRDTVTERSTSIVAAAVTLQQRTSDRDIIDTGDTTIERMTIQEIYRRDLPIPPSPFCTVTVAGVDDNGAESPVATLRVEEFMSTIAHPLLNYIFFDPNSSQLSDRYTVLRPGEASSFSTENLYGEGTLNVYHTMLNIIGKRMREHPHATLTLTGCNMDFNEEKGNLELSRRRAETIRDYLTGVWGIEAGRMRVETTNLPAKRSNPLTPDGQAEDRRVEISSDTPEILDVLVSGDTTRTATPPTVRLRPSITAAQGIATWTLRLAQHGATLKEFTGTGAPPSSIDWDPVGDRAHLPRFNDSIEITLEAADQTGEVTRCTTALATRVVTIREKREQQLGDFTIDRYNLILFNVGESGITPANRRIIDMVSSRLKPNSQITVEGFADRTGSAASNQQLSALRAEATAHALNRPDATTRGIGEARLLYPNDTPEGRFYCRTVQITVKTPLGR